MNEQKTNKKKDRVFNLADVILGVVLLALGISSAFVVNAMGDAGNSVLVEAGGAYYGEYSLNQDQEITIENNGHINRFAIRNGEARMVYADCPDQYCIRDGAISKTNESIVCLPNQVVISTPLSADGEVDSISQ